MRQTGYIILMIFFTIQGAFAQPGKPHRMERIHAIKVAYLTDKIQLTTEQSEKFWPVYRKYEDEMFALRSEYFKKHGGRGEQMSDEDSRRSIDDDIEMQEKMVAIRKKYKAEFLTIISTRQLASLYEAEREFKKMLIQQLRERRGNRQVR